MAEMNMARSFDRKLKKILRSAVSCCRAHAADAGRSAPPDEKGSLMANASNLIAALAAASLTLAVPTRAAAQDASPPPQSAAPLAPPEAIPGAPMGIPYGPGLSCCAGLNNSRPHRPPPPSPRGLHNGLYYY
jgi:hypothetical protein